MSHADPCLARVIVAFESLTRAELGRLDALYAADASFKDPFNDVRGVPAIRRIFEHMFDTLVEPASSSATRCSKVTRPS
jgi:ketosteroid isomerase-like protein